MKALSLMYHDVVEPGRYAASGFPGDAADAYKLETGLFQRHLAAVHQSPSRSLVSVIQDPTQWSGTKVFLTFDDGGESAHTIVADLLESFGWRGHFFVTTGRIGAPAFLTGDQIRDLHKRGHVIGSHSRSHPMRISHLPQERLEEEWAASVQQLSGLLGEPVKTASVPGGFYSSAVAAAAAKAGIEVLFTSEPTARPQTLDGCLILGRYALLRGMAPERSREFAEGRFLPCFRQALTWRTKQTLKSMGGFQVLQLLWSWKAGSSRSRP